MSENSKKILELTEAMRAEGDIRIRDRMVGVPYLPTATPRPGAAESVWKDAEYRLAASEHYETREDPAHAASECLRTRPVRPDIYSYGTAAC